MHRAKAAGNDEFYTQLSDINDELRHYKSHLRGQTVYLNCDDPWESNFFKYFASQFDHLGLRRLIATSYAGSPAAAQQITFDDLAGVGPAAQAAPQKHAIMLDIRAVGDRNGDGAVNIADAEWLLRNDANTSTLLRGGGYGPGDFRSPECVDLLKQADIVVTNPPFSLFRDYISQLVAHRKRFLILGNMNAITYKEVFPLIQAGHCWLGVNNGGTKWFQVPHHYDVNTESRKKVVAGVKYISLGSVVWFTNLDHRKRHQPLPLWKKYAPEEYPRYDNYDAIEVGKVADIPVDYVPGAVFDGKRVNGVMGVPITFLDKWCPEQFEVVGMDRPLMLNGIEKYARIIIRRR